MIWIYTQIQVRTPGLEIMFKNHQRVSHPYIPASNNDVEEITQSKMSFRGAEAVTLGEAVSQPGLYKMASFTRRSEFRVVSSREQST